MCTNYEIHASPVMLVIMHRDNYNYFEVVRRIVNLALLKWWYIRMIMVKTEWSPRLGSSFS